MFQVRQQPEKVAYMKVIDATPPICNLADMIAACCFDGWINPDINEVNFLVKPELFTTDGANLFHFNRQMTTSEVEIEIRNEGYEPASIERLLAYAKEHPDEQRKYPIVAQGSSWVNPDGDRRFPCLGGGRHERDLGLDLDWRGPSGILWREGCRFLASRKSSS